MQNQRGFIGVGVVLLIVLGLIVVGGGAYYVGHQSASQTATKNFDNVPTLPTTNNPAQATTNTSTQTTQTQNTQTQKITATIDQSSLTTLSTTPTITGTATGEAIFGINITNDNDQRLYSGKLSVVNGRWSLKVSPALLPGTYPVYVYATPLSGDTTKNVALASGTLIVNAAASTVSVSVSGMTKYTDADFGFSFWYPSGWTVSNLSGTGPGMFAGTTDKAGNLSAGRIMVRGDGMELDIDKVTSTALAYKINVGACGTCDPKTYYFDTAKHLWMLSTSFSANVAPASGGQPADISNNTMGGLHIFYGQNKQLTRIVPLSARNFLSITDAAGWTGTPNEDAKVVSLTKTIVATDPSVATPVSAAEQTQTIQAEASAFSN